MRYFYSFWFFFCSGWGYLLTTFTEEHAPSWPIAFLTLPIALVSSIFILWLDLSKHSADQLASPPSMSLKPWNRPIGMLMFIGLTFTFSSFWGFAITALLNQGSNRLILQFFSLGAGAIGGCYAIYRIAPTKFGD
jgi:hypothetical protein